MTATALDGIALWIVLRIAVTHTQTELAMLSISPYPLANLHLMAGERSHIVLAVISQRTCPTVLSRTLGWI